MLVVAVLDVLVFGCSGASEETNVPPSSTGTFQGTGKAPGSSGTSDAGAPRRRTSDAGAPTPPTTLDACIAQCESQHATGARVSADIDTCWADNCVECQNMPPGPIVGTGGADCKQPVWTPSQACSQCTVRACCENWDACFGNNDCKALAACSDACFKNAK